MYTGANIVRSGLVLALDAANTKSYPVVELHGVMLVEIIILGL